MQHSGGAILFLVIQIQILLYVHIMMMQWPGVTSQPEPVRNHFSQSIVNNKGSVGMAPTFSSRLSVRPSRIYSSLQSMCLSGAK